MSSSTKIAQVRFARTLARAEASFAARKGKVVSLAPRMPVLVALRRRASDIGHADAPVTAVKNVAEARKLIASLKTSL